MVTVRLFDMKKEHSSWEELELEPFLVCVSFYNLVMPSPCHVVSQICTFSQTALSL
jgi:hypothetical protein